MRSEVINCDVCNATKGEGNRWLMGILAYHGYALGDWRDDMQDRTLNRINHFCSESCALKYQSRYLRQDKVA